MRRRITAAVLSLGLAASATPAGLAIPAASASRAGSAIRIASIAKTCPSGFVRGVVLGNQKCLHAGEYCTHTRRAERDYRRYHFSCAKRDYRGRYHLVRV
jgi:hypothetical protein